MTDEINQIVRPIFIARVIWTRIGGSGSMADMRDDYAGVDVAYCTTYEEAVEAALPFCRRKSEEMHVSGYTSEAHATIQIRMEYLCTKPKTCREMIDRYRTGKTEKDQEDREEWDE